METAPLDYYVREFDVTSHISLAGLDLLALMELREKGECHISLPEPVFDIDFPGHYMRRIKSVALSIPCEAGHYTNEIVTLTLVSNKVRMTTSPLPHYSEQDPKDPRFAYGGGAIQSGAARSARNDPDLFEVTVSDERYLPFEGVGAISQWHLDMRTTSNQIDFSTIADVVLHLRYTARDASASLREGALAAARALRNPTRVPSSQRTTVDRPTGPRSYSEIWSGPGT